jgi:pyrimidine-specific ribonucleoside hydrolase
VYRGADAGGTSAHAVPSPASRALAEELRRTRLTVIALGPLTNLAAVLVREPALARRLRGVVAVAGTRPGERRLKPSDRSWLHLHDLNFLADPDAFERVLAERVALALLGFETARSVSIGPDQLHRLAGGSATGTWLAATSAGWLAFWRGPLGAPGFHPFDTLAVGYVIDPTHFDCAPAAATVVRRRSLFRARHALQVDPDASGRRGVVWCTRAADGFRDALVTRLRGFDR